MKLSYDDGVELIVTHDYTDFDALAAQLAAAKLYREALPVLSPQLNDNVAEFVGLHRRELPFVRRADLPRHPAIERVILVDTQGPYGPIEIPPETPLVVIDHHPPERRPRPWEQFIYQQVGATTTILVQRLREGGAQLSPTEATLLLLGIYEDTGSLSYQGTTSADVHCAAWLLDQGADIGAVHRYLHRPLTQEQEQVYHLLLDSLKIEEIAGWPVLLGHAQLESRVEELSVLAHRLRDVYEPAALFLCIGIGSSGTQLIARSNGEAVDAGEIARRLGGGGHRVAAAAFVRNRPAGKVRAEVERLVRELIRPALTARDIMTTQVQTIAQGASMAQAAERLERTGYRSLPVVDAHGRPVGLIGRREIDKAQRHGLSASPVRTYMWKGPAIVAPETPIQELRRIMAGEERGPILVASEGRLVGLITRGDLLRQTEAPPAAPDQTTRIVERLEATLSRDVLELLRRVGAIAEERGWSVYLVGGPVRDLLLGRPVLDLDLVVEGDAIALARAIAEEQGAPMRSHEQFGTAALMLHGTDETTPGDDSPRHLDFVTARIEFYEHPTALPSVEAASLRHDLHRRDFTINTLAISLNPGRFGKLYDFYGGQRDLQRGLIRVLHNLSFIDDPTRLLRAARLAARLGFTIEPRTQALIADALEQGVLSRTTPQRIRHELTRTLEEAQPERAIRLLDELGILQAIHPNLRWSPALDERFQRARKRGLASPDTYLLLLLYDLPATELAAPGHDDEQMLWALLTGHQRQLVYGLGQARHALPSLRAGELSDGALDGLLHGREPLALQVTAIAEGGKVAERITRYLEVLRPIPTLLAGHDLRALGVRPGPIYGKLLHGLRAAQLDGLVSNRQEALAWVRRQIAALHEQIEPEQSAG